MTFETRNYLITVDYFSNFLEIDYLENTLATTVIHKLRAQFARHGIPDTCFSDNGPQFNCVEFSNFTKEWDFSHTASSPYYPQRNVKVEHAVQTAKSLMERQAHYYNRGTKELSSLKEGDGVSVEPANKYQKTWEKETVNKKEKHSEEIRDNRIKRAKTKQEQFNSESNEFEDDEQFDHVEQQENCNNNTIPQQSPQENTLDNNTTTRTRSGRQTKDDQNSMIVGVSR
ncbi:Hypothetical predicted protein [Mytilus galloprovincialis]|uniref:Integrase catalytic domain-containing protein n=1 Tax=Mytilus galloprovincialis TaxID=29158 RepID=A0A8B6GKC0_MYTGA|nr:Hypothetical predicted protein [Mytilus galloprovincialis]